jgi:hypothetical protein
MRACHVDAGHGVKGSFHNHNQSSSAHHPDLGIFFNLHMTKETSNLDDQLRNMPGSVLQKIPTNSI